MQANIDAVGIVIAHHINTEGLNLIETNEGDKHQAYRDIAGIPTIGYGHTGPDVHMGLVITEAQAVALLQKDLARFEDAVYAATHDVPTTSNQFSAMVSLTYNIGEGGFRSSSVLRLHRIPTSHPAVVAAAFLNWDKSHVNGVLVVVAGLERRRKEEGALYLKPDFNHMIPIEMPSTPAPSASPMKSAESVPAAPPPPPVAVKPKAATKPKAPTVVDPDSDAAAEALNKAQLAGG